LSSYYDTVSNVVNDPKLAANWVLNEVLRYHDDASTAFPVSASRLAELLHLIEDGTISGKIAKSVFEIMLDDARAPQDIVEAEGLMQITDTDALQATIKEIVAAHPDEAQRFREGEDKLLGFFMGQVMRATEGKANPQTVRELLTRMLRA